MLVDQYMKQENLSIVEFADLIGVHSMTIYRYFKDKKGIHKHTALLIEDYTNGEVSRVEAMFPEMFAHLYPNSRFYKLYCT